MKIISRITIFLLGSFVEKYAYAGRSTSDELVDNLIEKSVNATSEYVVKTGSINKLLHNSFNTKLKHSLHRTLSRELSMGWVLQHILLNILVMVKGRMISKDMLWI